MKRPSLGVSYFGNRFAGHAHRDLAVISQVCDHVVHTFSETDLNYHKAAMERIFRETRRWKLEAWADPWGLGGVFGGEALSKFLLDHPGDWQRYSDGRSAPAACLNGRAFTDFIKEWVDVAADLGAQVIFWDEPHVAFNWTLEWEGTYCCACARCGDLFEEMSGSPLPRRLNDDVREFRRRTIRHFLGDVMSHARKKGLKNALCLYAFEGYRDYDRLWQELAALPALDVFGCDPYWRWSRGRKSPEKHVSHYADKLTRSIRPDQGSQVWVQSMRLPAGAEGEISRAVQAAASRGVSHITAWSFDGGALLDPVLAENPGRVWAETAKAFSSLRGK